ncbi:MAG: hypothetical protein Kow0010_17200 [Dehalococcoidia bacterium]
MLDQNFPVQAEPLPWPPFLRVSRLSSVEPDLVSEPDDWRILLALDRRGDVRGFVTNDGGILSSPREMVVLQRTKQFLVVAERVGHDAIRATGLIMTHLVPIARQVDGRPAVFRLRPGQVPRQNLDSLLNQIANHLSVSPRELSKGERQALRDEYGVNL